MGESSSDSVTPRRRPIPRKGHRKSRAGCLVCKKRKVKCDEINPSCGPCNRLGMACQYGSGPPGDLSTAMMTTGRSLQTVPTAFTMDDLMFFQHFLFSAYPSLPIGGWSVWQQVAQMCHQYDFLAHSMLALGASHMSLLNSRKHEKEALNHRIHAIQGLNAHFTKADLSLADRDAAFGTLLNLLFQSSYMAEGLPDFFSMIRGCVLVGSSLLPDFEQSRFRTFERKYYVERVQRIVSTDDLSRRFLDKAIADGFCASVRRLGPLCRSVPEVEYLGQMQRILESAITSPLESYRELTFMYDRLGNMTSDMFTSFLDPSNHVSHLVIIHVLTLELIMDRKELEDTDKQRFQPDTGRTIFNDNMRFLWIDDMIKQLPASYRKYASWVSGFIQHLSFSADAENELWKPFLLHQGTIPVSASGKQLLNNGEIQ